MAAKQLSVMDRVINFALLTFMIAVPEVVLSQAARNSAAYSISTPRPINPAASTTNLSALATQGPNPYLGSTPAGKVTDQVIPISLRDAVSRGLRYNLGLIESNQASAQVRAQRLRALSALLHRGVHLQDVNRSGVCSGIGRPASGSKRNVTNCAVEHHILQQEKVCQ